MQTAAGEWAVYDYQSTTDGVRFDARIGIAKLCTGDRPGHALHRCPGVSSRFPSRPAESDAT